MSSMVRLNHSRTFKRGARAAAVLVAAVFMFLTSAFSAWAATNITITFVRHGESEGNASGLIDTKIPGPNLTTTGQTQAQTVAGVLANDGLAHDAIFASDMVRTQQTAAPYATATGMPVTVLSGLHEVQAGIFEGQSQDSGFARILYALIPLSWATGNLLMPMPGSPDANGAVFQDRFNGAVDDIYNSGAQNPVAFAHGMSIMAWTLMNVENPDLTLMLKHPLGNTEIVTVTGNPEDGWTLENWGGIAVTQNPALPTKLFVNVRDAVKVPQMALYNVAKALRTGNIANVANAIRDGVFDTAKAVVNLPINVVKSVVKSVQTGTVFKAAPPPASVQAVTPNTAAAKEADSADKPAVTPTLAKQVSALKPATTGTKDKTVKATKADDTPADTTKADDVKAGDTKAGDSKTEDTPKAGTGDKGAADKGTKVKKDKPKKDKSDKADKPKAEKPKKAEKQQKDKAAKADAAK
ncbi:MULTISPECIES: histidine phosphatase family protein [unclassified Mycobacterium]|uniref:histidine phosphatase family protein n=1 Tax=unclassified Mycobacterium TaxID=2642494 RepID=UPI0008955ABA|nr:MULTISPECIES: histidine phosphatase family protein [unclassified Mycobacterium]SEB23751.1 Broad specificity phosphatase PhoE [Mycobacterium sp. 283mftsu]